MAKYTPNDITRINADGTAVPNRVYESTDGRRYIGTFTRRLTLIQTDVSILADQSVSNTEFQTLDNARENIQEQIDNIPSGATEVKTLQYVVSDTLACRGKFTVSNVSVNSSSKIEIWQAFVPLNGKGSLADENEMDRLIVSAESGDEQMTVYWQTVPLSTPTKPPKRLGKVRGSFTFNYIVYGSN